MRPKTPPAMTKILFALTMLFFILINAQLDSEGWHILNPETLEPKKTFDSAHGNQRFWFEYLGNSAIPQ